MEGNHTPLDWLWEEINSADCANSSRPSFRAGIQKRRFVRGVFSVDDAAGSQLDVSMCA
jgi:hypothetical protein